MGFEVKGFKVYGPNVKGVGFRIGVAYFMGSGLDK